MNNIKSSPIAIVGFSGVFPQAPNCDLFWRNIQQKVDSTRRVPAKRWAGPFGWVYSEDLEEDRAYSKRACLVDGFEFDPSGYQIDETILRNMDPLVHWVLHASKSALAQTDASRLDRTRIGVILAAIALPTEISSTISRKILGHRLFTAEGPGIPTDAISQEEMISGRVVSMPGSLVSLALGLGEAAYTLDAACASSLYAIKLACDMLSAHRADAMIAGGVSRPDPLYTQIGFSQLRALSASGRCAPFDLSADGLVVGEGAGIMILKRLDDALTHGDTIHGVIRGIGLSNDMRGNLLAPESDGQLRAMQAAYRQAGWRPQDVDHIECHGTGTPMGDATELQSLRRLWGDEGWDKGQCAIGSIKSMIGHLLTAAGAAGMIKTLLALAHKSLPPSLKFEEAKSDSPLIDSPFRVQTDLAPWPQRDKHTPRRAAVSAFGFGGINAHVLIEEWMDIEPKAAATTTDSTPIAIVGMGLHLGTLSSLQDFQEAVFKGRTAVGSPAKRRWKAPEYIIDLFGDHPAGNFIDHIEMAPGEFQIPPGEIPDILPQQLLMLKTAAGALEDARMPLRQARERMGAIIGIGFDFEATNFHLRWALPNMVDQWGNALALPESPEEREPWLLKAKEGCGPPLTATRTLGALGGIVASRIAREFRFGGPSFVISAEEASGLIAIDIAKSMLQAREVDAMLVGAVDLNGDERNMATLYRRLKLSSRGRIRPFDGAADGTLPGEGAVALVLKRMDDALAGKDRIYAVIEGIGSAGSRCKGDFETGPDAYTASLDRTLRGARVSPGQIGLMETHGSGIPSQDVTETAALHNFFEKDCDTTTENRIAVGTLKPITGHTGVTSGLASLAKAALCLKHQILAPASQFTNPATDHWQKDLFYFPRQGVFWPGNRADGPRRACIAAVRSDGSCSHAILRQADIEPHTVTVADRRLDRPMGRLRYGLFLISAKDKSLLLDGLSRLAKLEKDFDLDPPEPMEALAHHWHCLPHQFEGDRPSATIAILADGRNRLKEHIAAARQAVQNDTPCQMAGRGGIAYQPHFFAAGGQMAFVYPGSGNHYIGMGRTLGARWPEVLRQMEASTDRFKSQLLPQWYDPWGVDWSDGWERDAYDALVADPLRTIFGQVLFGGQLTILLKNFNITPEAVIGYSLGESAGLFAMGAWPDRGEMLERLERSELFKTQLAGPYQAVRRAWKIREGQPITWKVAAVNRDAETVDHAIGDLPYVRRLIVNTPEQCVIGGLEAQVDAAINNMNATAVFLDGVVSVHCDAARPAEKAYHDLHRFETHPVQGVQFYSCGFGKALELTTESAAASITRQALDGFDFPRTIEQAYEDGIRIFLEVGPHSSCTRMIDRILKGKPHLAVAANHRGEDESLTFLKCLGTLAAAGCEINMDALYGYPGEEFKSSSRPHPAAIRVPVGGPPLSLPAPRSRAAMQKLPPKLPLKPPMDPPKPEQPTLPEPAPSSLQRASKNQPPAGSPQLDFNRMIERLNQNTAATAKAHEQFLQFSQELTAQYSQALAWQQELLSGLDPSSTHLESFDNQPEQPERQPQAPSEPAAFDRDQCMAFAIGSVGKMLGPEFDIIDTYKARVRLPDEPLMLVDRIISVQGERLSLGAGRVVTEHDVIPGAWYLDGERAPVCISVEAGQADLFLCSYLGIDHKVKGERTYRLLDAKIRFHRGLPRPGETIRYDIRIDKFVRQGETYLFLFRFEGHIGDSRLITMSEGCAGFFTEEEVRNSGGIILTKDDKIQGATVNGSPFTPLIPQSRTTYGDDQVDALRRGDAGTCFGHPFDGIRLPESLCLPDGRMRLIHRIVSLEPDGGRFGKGFVKAEADIHPDDWFLTCHFVDDMVMPGTLMYECCAHTLRVLLLRLGWVTDKVEVAYEPVAGLDCRLKCRGPVTPSTRRVHYCVEIKEIGYHPEPYVIADAHMYADGEYIVFFKDMSMQMTGVVEQDINRFWQTRAGRSALSSGESAVSSGTPLFAHDQILEFAVGSPSKAFGRPYAVFDSERTIARLPGPPYCFMDRVVAIEPEPWKLAPGGWVEAEYTVPADAWYFTADASGAMPFCVLLEIALQPCGWLAAYAGSALKSENDLKFRNLGGKAELRLNLPPQNRTLTVRTRITKVSEAADMIIEHFEFDVLAEGRSVYGGTTYFGFFTHQALAQQVGLREPVYLPSEADLKNPSEITLDIIAPITPEAVSTGTVFQPAGLSMPGKALCMIDGIEHYAHAGGPHGLGFIRGYKIIDPQEWFFKAHFYQDPVCPGSLGIESFLQLIKFAALKRWPRLKETHRFEMTVPHGHQWSYRGQVIPSNRKVTVEAVITSVADGDAPIITANGCLQVDGIYIYKMDGFSLQLVPL